MQIAGLELYVNHPVMALGASEWIPTSLELRGEPASACDTHVLVRVQAQTTLVKVRIFLDDVEPRRRDQTDEGFTTVFDGPLLLADGRFVVGDLMAQSRFTTALLGLPSKRLVNVAVDDPHGLACAVDITIGKIVL
ncbi:hypothetical protein NC315_37655 [Streptomyces sp. G2]|uniref:hypothetical protein n=1 Tax=Streptomyces sp. G2 TaxID=1684471 RepID=UPI00202FFB7C|nr:hypothetical protein [Streptomyces sp. G2]MCM1951045.1 hypothetical protein [Streptomyces sp. G2]